MSGRLTRGTRSEAERLLALSPRDVRRALKKYSDEQLEALRYDWRFWARPEQLPPADGDWTTWCIFGGRGIGKTRSAGEMVIELVEKGEAKYPILIGADAEDVRKVMIEGESGIMNISPPHFRPKYEPSKKTITWPNGVVGNLFGAHEPNKLRGPQSDLIWADELGKWRYATEAWDNAVFGNRLGRPRRIVTSTPKPVAIIRKLMGKDPTQRGLPKDPTIVQAPVMATYDNLANLAPEFIRELLTKYQGTRLGRQELMGELLLDMPGALWTLKRIERDRLSPAAAPPLSDMVRIVVAIDPAVTSGDDSAETGIIVAGRSFDDHFYVWADRSGRVPADKWAKRAVTAYTEFSCDRVVGEVNNGGDLVEAQLRVVAPLLSYKAVHASRGKRTRGEPVAALYEQRRVHHVGTFDLLEDQMITWVPDAGDESPDRADALVWAITELADFTEPTQIPGTQSSRSYR